MKHGAFLRGLGGLVAAYALGIAANVFGLERILYDAIVGAPTYDEAYWAAVKLFSGVWGTLSAGYKGTLTLATVAMPVAAIVRFVWRVRVRAQELDSSEKPRAFTKNHPTLVAALAALPPLLWTYFSATVLERTSNLYAFDDLLVGFAAPAFVIFGTQYLLVRTGWRAMTAPLFAGDLDRTAEGFTFQAVAVTARTRAMVAAVGVLSLAMLGLVYSLKVSTMMHNPVFIGTLLGYLALTVGTAAFFVQASRISVGLDGVYISGTARARFVPYRDIDSVKLEENDLDLMNGSERVLRLQLHGDDALRREALAGRIRVAIEQAATQRGDTTVAFVDNANVGAIERAAAGASNYREVTPSREKLWEMLDSPALDAKGRSAAATALAKECSTEEYERLKVMAENTADPAVRSHLRSLVVELEEFAQEAHAKADSRRKMSLDATK